MAQVVRGKTDFCEASASPRVNSIHLEFDCACVAIDAVAVLR